MNNKAHYGLIDASTLPKFLLYPLIFIICILLLTVSLVLILSIISWFNGDTKYVPFGSVIGYHGTPFMVSSHTYSSQECSVNGVKINCSEVYK